jgi:hypothetical protein
VHNSACKLARHDLTGKEYDKLADRLMQCRSQQDGSRRMLLVRPLRSYRCIMQWLFIMALTAASVTASRVAAASKAIASAPVLYAMMNSGAASVGRRYVFWKNRRSTRLHHLCR